MARAAWEARPGQEEGKQPSQEPGIWGRRGLGLGSMTGWARPAAWRKPEMAQGLCPAPARQLGPQALVCQPYLEMALFVCHFW